MVFACEEHTLEPSIEPRAVTIEDIGYYCNMVVQNHSGPKAQIILTDNKQAIWFTSVRDSLAFTMIPGEPKNIGAFFVTAMDDMKWDHPEQDMGNWGPAQSMFYVINSTRRGGMGQNEAIPFRSRQNAISFTARYGGNIVKYDVIPHDYILGNDPLTTTPSTEVEENYYTPLE